MDSQSFPPNEANPPRMFYGEYERGLDSKGRITLPAQIREALGDEDAILTRGLDKCLFLFPRSQFEELREKIRTIGLASREARNFRRHVFSGAAPIKPNGVGRINLPSYLRDFADLTDSVIVAGIDTYVEIWDAKRWQEQLAQFEEDAVNMESWKHLGI